MKKVFLFLTCMFVAFTTNAQTYSYDVNHDGEISIKDVMCIVNKILGIPNPGEGQSEPESYLTCPDGNHPHLIDLGLPSGTKWACCNVGADKPEAYGGYYAWGETEEKSYYDWSTYIHCDGEELTCHDLGDDIAGTQYDVVHVKWGGSWVMPSIEQQDELLEYCTSIWTTQNGVNGRVFTGPNGGSIFLPAAGNRWDDYLYGAGSVGNYWSSTQSPSYSYFADFLGFDSGDANWLLDFYRGLGRTVRPVSR